MPALIATIALVFFGVWTRVAWQAPLRRSHAFYRAGRVVVSRR